MNKYFSKDISEIIKKKISLDYKKYKFWCNVEAKWIYVWSEYNCKLTCPNNKYHLIEFIRIIDNVKANGNMLKITKIESHNSNIIETEFEIVKV
jgi:hypothetical protein